MICKKCKQEIPDDAVVCRYCGEIIEENMEKKVREKEQEIQAMEEDEQSDASIEDLLREPLPTDFKVTEPVRYRESQQYQERKKQVRKTIIMTAGMLAATIAVGVGTVFLVRKVVLKPDETNQVVKVDPGANAGNNNTPGDAAVKNETEKESETDTKETEKKKIGSVSIQASAKQKGESEGVTPVTVRKTEKETEGKTSTVKVHKTEEESEKTVSPVEVHKTEKESENIPPVTIKKENETEAPETNPPETNPPETNPPETNPPETNPPETNPPETNPPETEAPDDGYQDGWGEEEGPIYNGGGYILPNSSSELLTRDSLVGLNAGDLLLARNEIFARHGRMFDDEWLQSYFDSQPWYQPIYSPSEFSYDLLSAIEIENINTILAYEAELGA